MNTDRIYIHLTGDRAQGESLVRFALKKLKELPSVRGENTSRRIILPGSVSVTVQHTADRQNIFIHVPVPALPENKEIPERKGITEGLLLLYGMPWEVLVLESQEGTFLSGEDVSCGDGRGEIFLVAGRNLVGQYIRCWESGDFVSGDLSGSTGVISECRAMVYEFTYKSDFVFSRFERSPGFIVSSPADIFRRMCRDNLNQEWRTHTLAAGNPVTGWMTVTAVEHQPYAFLGLAFLTEWFLCGKYNGRQVTFDGEFSSVASLRENNRVLFDVWEEEGVYYVSAVMAGKLKVWAFDKKEYDFTETISELCDIIGPNPAQGLDKTRIYGYYDNPELGTLSMLTAEYKNAEWSTDEKQLKTNNTTATYIDNLWNPYNKTFYVAWNRHYEQEPPQPPIVDTVCQYYTLLVTGIWYGCDFTCGFTPYLFNDTPCSPGNCSFCDAQSGNFVLWEKTGVLTVEGTDYYWTVPYAHNWDISGNVNTLYGTHYQIGIVLSPQLYKYPDFVITPYKFGENPSGSELPGGSVIQGDYAYKTNVSINDGGYDYFGIPQDEWGAYCRGSYRSYVKGEWVFTADEKGYFIKYTVTEGGCHDPIVYTDHIGNNKYLPGYSIAPHDHNWTLIVRDTEDTEGNPISNLLFYAENAGTKIFYDGEEDFTYLPGNGNRAFLQYAIKGE